MRFRTGHRLEKWLEVGRAHLFDGYQGDPATWYQSLTEPVALELGCGRGAFIRQMARLHPNTRFVGVDRVLAVAAKAAYGAALDGLDNLSFFVGDVERFGPLWTEPRVAWLYLNFSDPWPKKRHHKRRLTAPDKLSWYAKWMRPEAWLEQKTDNPEFFEWSLASFQASGWEIAEVERGLPPGDPDGTLSGKYVQTEYEMRFRQLGQPIFYLRARPAR
ncbi:tRNA (guanosine(46)-N7)-methyltransferase TrmB [Alicyclobacillus sendaiensis]|uniref:tRNA (guanine-N(7)-)-methyltransferase n=1 Tax=Alicyclobacillus sendaiensis PA2 TaxID=3029425 RepID=A0ABT6XU81_ALISE|nr:tRNA (guanosine(46)-N7)-methyltransferase TrmB [Alicyclobacillus sendaiensis]MDI9258638.1 tRNA (guanosine(46)-N7)-methyltransferase TrmB [Alicyclobacillus sendaiensis PA2]